MKGLHRKIFPLSSCVVFPTFLIASTALASFLLAARTRAKVRLSAPRTDDLCGQAFGPKEKML